MDPYILIVSAPVVVSMALWSMASPNVTSPVSLPVMTPAAAAQFELPPLVLHQADSVATRRRHVIIAPQDNRHAGCPAGNRRSDHAGGAPSG